MPKIKIDVDNPNWSALRHVIFERLRKDPSWKVLDGVDVWLSLFVELNPERFDDRTKFERLILQMFWELAIAGIVFPGKDSNQSGFPWFHVTPYGQRVMAAGEYAPHDRDGYVSLLTRRVPNADATVLAYLDESIETFGRGNNVAAMVMLGVAAERVFDLLCDSLDTARSLQQPATPTQLSGVFPLTVVSPRLTTPPSL